jgi:hypothetical protein
MSMIIVMVSGGLGSVVCGLGVRTSGFTQGQWEARLQG